MTPRPASYIGIYPGFIPDDFCKKVVSDFESDADGQFSGKLSNGYNPKMKFTTDLCITVRGKEIPKVWADIDYSLWEYVGQAFKKYCEEFEIDKHTNLKFIDTQYNIQKYIKNKGYFKPHNDSSNLKTSNRFAAIIIYLNDVDRGGETYFENWDIKVKPEVGKILIFPTGFTYIHEGFIPVSNDKYIMTTFITYP